MIKMFLRQHASWLLLLMGLQLFLNVLLFVDAGIKNVSFVYFNSVWLVLVLCFCGLRYTFDQRLMKHFPERERDYYTTIQCDYEKKIDEQKVQIRQQYLQLLEKQDELLAWVHEMKAPLTVMKLLQQNVEDRHIKDCLENEWLRMHLLLDQQLHATRLMAIEQDSVLQQVNVQEVVAQEVKELRSWFFEKQIALDMDRVNLTVASDAKWLGFIVRQLLMNALKYSETGQEIHMFSSEENGKAMLHIQDFGQGIAVEDLPRVFRKAYTGSLGRETSAATGMGLYLVKQAAEAMHIEVSISSEVDVGTTVHLQFPQMNNYIKTFGM